MIAKTTEEKHEYKHSTQIETLEQNIFPLFSWENKEKYFV